MAVWSTQDFSAVYGRWMPSLTRYCRTILRSDADAEDAAQNAMLKAMDALATGPAPDELTPWLHRIARNEAISLMRRRRGDAELMERHHEHGPAPEEVIGTRDRLAQLVADVQALPERQRQALVLRELDGLPYRQIATMLHVTEGAAQQAVLDARRSMTECETGRALECESVQGWLNGHEHALVRGRKVRAHLRSCTGCRSFAAGLGTRPRELALLLPLGSSGMGLLARIAALLSGGGALGKAVLGAGLLATAGVGLGALVVPPGSGDSAESSSRPAQVVGSSLSAPALLGGARVTVPVSRAAGPPSGSPRRAQRTARRSPGGRTSGSLAASRPIGGMTGQPARTPPRPETEPASASPAPTPASATSPAAKPSSARGDIRPSSPVASATAGTPAAQVTTAPALAPVVAAVTPVVEQVTKAAEPVVKVITDTVATTTSTADQTTATVTQTVTGVTGVTGRLLGGG